MAVTIAPTRKPVDATQLVYLRDLLVAPGFQILKELVASRCAEHQVNAMNRQLYPDNQTAVEGAHFSFMEAIKCAQVLDIITDIEADAATPEKLYVVNLQVVAHKK